MKLAETIILTILVIFSLAVAPVAIGFSGWDDSWSGGWDDGWSNGWGDGWSDSWEDDWSNGWDVDDSDSDSGDSDPNDWGDDESDDSVSDDWPTHWNRLDEQSVLEDSADNTIVYSNLRNQCISGSAVNVQVVHSQTHYDLTMSGDDLVISNLEQNYWDNGELVALSCNGIASFFKLTIAPVNDAPVIVGLSDITINMNEGPLVLNLVNYESDVDNSHSQLSWTVSQRTASRTVFDADLSGKTLTITPKSRGGEFLTFRLSDPSGLHDDKRITVRVVSGDHGVDDDDDEEDDDRLGIFVSSIRINSNGNIAPGDQIEAYITLKNSGDYDLDNTKITMVIQEIAARGVVGPFDLDDGETATKFVRLDIEDNAVITESVYNVRFTVSNDETRRVVYREVDVDLA